MKRPQSNNGVLKLSAGVTHTALLFGGFIDTDVKDSTCLHQEASVKRIVRWGLLISPWCPCPLAIWAFALDGNLVKYCYIWSTDITPHGQNP